MRPSPSCCAMFWWLLLLFSFASALPQPSHPRLLADAADIAQAKRWYRQHAWYRQIIDRQQAEIDRLLERRPIYVSPVKQTYQYKMYTCPRHDVELQYELFRPHDHRCPVDTTEVYRGEKYDAAWSGWYNRELAGYLVWMGILYQLHGEQNYAEAGREILMQFADLYLKYPITNTILGPAHVFFGTLSESFWGVDMAYGYDLLYNYDGFTPADRRKLKEKLFYPLAEITQKFPESASNRQLWYNNVSAAVGFLYDDPVLIAFALKGRYGFEWQLGSATPASGFWAEGPGYHYVALRGMIHLAEMARHNGIDLYRRNLAGRTLQKMFDVPFELIKPNYEFPRIKDSGGGNLQEYAPFYEIGYALYRDPRYLALLHLTTVKRDTQVVGEESGPGSKRTPISMFNLVPELPFPADTTSIYPEASFNLEGNGFAILRNREGDNRRYLYLDYGLMGGEHGHPDRLQMGYYALGENWIVDPLNESYFNPNLQLWYRQSIAHNTVVLNQTSQTWANGYGRFFGALPALQVASGGSVTAYPGATLTRTLLQVGDYFIDLFDVDCPEERLMDWPLHSFGRLEISGVALEAQPRNRFGHPPGIPGYDQLRDIHAGKTDGPWQAKFTLPNGKCLLVLAVGEPGTEVFQAMTPPIGGFYKQMVRDPQPVPMLMSRRRTASTRFAHLIHAFQPTPAVSAFDKTEAANTYRIHHARGEDILFAEVVRSRYWLLRRTADHPTLLAGFNLNEVKWRETTLFSSPLPLEKFECAWQGEKLVLLAPAQYGRLKLWAPAAKVVHLNGKPVTFRREGDYVIVRQPEGVVLQIADTTLFLGMKNQLTIRVLNPTGRPVSGRVKLSLPADWPEQVRSQLEWWGGIVNLPAWNKGPVQRQAQPVANPRYVGWLHGQLSEIKDIPAGGVVEFLLPITIPNAAPAVTYTVQVSFGTNTWVRKLRVTAPVTADLLLPNAEKETLLLALTNHTAQTLSVQPRLLTDPAWQISAPPAAAVSLAPHTTQKLMLPCKLSAYNAKEQLYPVRLQLRCGNFQSETVRDLYVGVAHYAATPPALQGNWEGWNRRTPMTIDKANQVCRLLMGNQPWLGPQDLSAKVYAMYDEAYLYIGAEVTDEVVITHWDFPVMSYPWDTDCMEVMLDTRTNSEQGHDPPTPGLFRHLSLAEYRITDFGAKQWQGGGAGGPLLPKPNLVPDAETYFTRTAQGYNLICRYPLASLQGVRAEPGCKIGFDIAINDNDGLNYRKNQHIWAGFTQNQSWWDVGTIGALVFGPK
ncbi:MAG: heparinase II/III family protein [candidate division KSB1 bacterium]|nr:heparinase II/III family protein [candidate division KSB1 bacterium]MDZ7276230.1 heparinase II/III family protein [candidate division KSB1 bacterium]MDZ7287964.1 heparinase II/III family protein [candidate division KSB1 bacterium]MDZ7300023.1 heparinase II/III family protein [candidate division KSB1 bacterium]MDZ7308556.1 heparinase II/III family protein [candidate division KSB1 bacterium]